MDLLMPQLGETVAEGKITKWFKSAGDTVKPGDNLLLTKCRWKCRRLWRDDEKLKPLVHQIETAGGLAHPFACDTRNEDQVIKLVDQIEREVAPIEVAVFNVGANFLLRNCRTLN